MFSELNPGPRIMTIVFNGLTPAKTYGIRTKDLSGRIELDAFVLLK